MTTVTITPAASNNIVDIIDGETQTFNCTTDSSRPAAWIQWYIGDENVKNQATPNPPQEDGDKFILTKLPNYEQSYKGKVKTHKYINRQNQSTTGKL